MRRAAVYAAVAIVEDGPVAMLPPADAALVCEELVTLGAPCSAAPCALGPLLILHVATKRTAISLCGCV